MTTLMTLTAFYLSSAVLCFTGKVSGYFRILSRHRGWPWELRNLNLSLLDAGILIIKFSWWCSPWMWWTTLYLTSHCCPETSCGVGRGSFFLYTVLILGFLNLPYGQIWMILKIGHAVLCSTIPSVLDQPSLMEYLHQASPAVRCGLRQVGDLGMIPQIISPWTQHPTY